MKKLLKKIALTTISLLAFAVSVFLLYSAIYMIYRSIMFSQIGWSEIFYILLWLSGSFVFGRDGLALFEKSKITGKKIS